MPGNALHYGPSIVASLRYALDTTNRGTSDALKSAMEQRVFAMNAMVEKYAKRFPKHTPNIGAPSHTTVLITGVTNDIGMALIAAFVENPDIHKVYALDRKKDVPLTDMLSQALAERGYHADGIVQSGKVVLIETNMDEDSLGLQPAEYNKVLFVCLVALTQSLTLACQIRDSVTHIVHNGTTFSDRCY
jgi:hypothetical protein